MFPTKISEPNFNNNYENAIINCKEPKFIEEIWKPDEEKIQYTLKSSYLLASKNILKAKPFNLQDRIVLLGQRDKNSLISCLSIDILSFIFQLKFKIRLKHREYIAKFYSNEAKKLLSKLQFIEKNGSESIFVINNYKNAIINCQEPKIIEKNWDSNKEPIQCTIAELKILNTGKISILHTLEMSYLLASIFISQAKPFNLQDRVILMSQQNKNSVLSWLPDNILFKIFKLKFEIELNHSEYIRIFYSKDAQILLSQLKSAEDFRHELNQCYKLSNPSGFRCELEKMEQEQACKCTLF